MVKGKAKRCLYITHCTQAELRQMRTTFGQYGTMNAFFYYQGVLKIEYDNALSASKVLSEASKFKWTIQKNNPLFSNGIEIRNGVICPSSPAKESQLPISDIVAHISKATTVDDQLLILESLCLTNDDIANRAKLLLDVWAILAQNFPRSDIYPFGSSVNRLGLLGCDIDVFFDMKNGTDDYKHFPRGLCNTPNENLHKEKVQISHKFLKRVSNLFLRDGGNFSNVMVIPSKRVPLIKLFVKSLNISLDLTFNNRLVVINTQLIKFWNDHDVRVRPVVLALKTWARGLDLIGAVNGGFSSYACCLLAYLFLIQRGLIPSPEEMSKKCLDHRLSIQNWDSSLCLDHSQYSVLQQTVQPMQLLIELFDYLCNLNFDKEVMILRSGTVLNKDDLPNNAGSNGFKLSSVGIPSVQDPFDLSHNVTKNVSLLTCERFVNGLRETCQCMSDGKKWLFSDLLSLEIIRKANGKSYLLYSTESDGMLDRLKAVMGFLLVSVLAFMVREIKVQDENELFRVRCNVQFISWLSRPNEEKCLSEKKKYTSQQSSSSSSSEDGRCAKRQRCDSDVNEKEDDSTKESSSSAKLTGCECCSSLTLFQHSISCLIKPSSSVGHQDVLLDKAITDSLRKRHVAMKQSRIKDEFDIVLIQRNTKTNVILQSVQPVNKTVEILFGHTKELFEKYI